MKRFILAASLLLAALALPASALAHGSSAICFDGILSDDAGQGCLNDGPYGGAPAVAQPSNAICYDGILSDDIGQGCTNDGGYTQHYYPTPATSYRPTSSYSSSSGASGVPACASESGTNYSTGPDNTNASSATGRYQIIASTHASICPDLGWSPGEQDQCAARIYRQQGAGAWVGCG